MMRSRVFIVAAILILIGGLAIAGAEARGWHRGFGHRGWRHSPLGYAARELDLSDVQRQQIRTIWDGERPALSKLAKRFAEENKRLSAATADGTINEAEVSSIAGLQGATVAELIVEKEHLKAKIYMNVLNPNQRERADRLLARWQSQLDELAGKVQ
jgi:Spy/CpxP family protein refolding chaperone